MVRRRGIGIVSLLAAGIGAVAVGAHASSAAPRAVTHGSTIDKTYSCRVRRQHYVDFYASPTLPPVDNQPQPGVLNLTTGARIEQQGGAVVMVAQVGVEAVKNSLRIDTSSCRRVKQQIPLTRKGLPGPAILATPSIFGHINERCTTTARVLFRLRLSSKNHVPAHALLAVRSDDAKKRPIAFYNWTARKVSAYTANSCVSTG
jgi:hypothetical protein